MKTSFKALGFASAALVSGLVSALDCSNDNAKGEFKRYERGSAIIEFCPGETPAKNTLLDCSYNGIKQFVEVTGQVSANVARGSVLENVTLSEGQQCINTGGPLSVSVGAPTVGRIMNLYSESMDEIGPIANTTTRPIHLGELPLTELTTSIRILETGIKVIDLLTPFKAGGRVGLFANAGTGLDVLQLELMNNIAHIHNGTSVIAEVDDRTREGNDLYQMLKETGIIDEANLSESHVSIIYAKSTETPAHKLRIGHAALSIAEYHRTMEQRDVLIFAEGLPFHVDGEEVFTQSQRIADSVNGSVSSIQELPSELIDTTLLELETRVKLSFDLAARHIYPAIDPLKSSSEMLNARIVGEEHFSVAQAALDLLQRYKELRDIVMILGIDELSNEDKQAYTRGQKVENFLTQPLNVAEVYTNMPGRYVTLHDTIRGIQSIINGELDDIPAQAFFMVGTIDEAIQNYGN